MNISRSGRVRKKNSLLHGFESIEKKKKYDKNNSPVPVPTPPAPSKVNNLTLYLNSLYGIVVVQGICKFDYKM